MKQLITLLLLVATVAVIGQAVSFTISVDLTQAQARGLQRATRLYNEQQRSTDTNWVNVTPRQYATSRFHDLLDSWNREDDEDNLRTLRELYQSASQAKRQAAADALK